MKKAVQGQKLNSKSKWAWLTNGQVFRYMDAFGQKLPTFNIKGSDRVDTIVGGFFSIILYMVIFMYSTLKLSHLISKHGPNISSYEKEDAMANVALNLNKRNSRFAFTIESYHSPYNQKSDPRYVKYLFRLYGKREGKLYQRVLPYHKCTEEEYNEFYPVKK